MSDHSDRSSRSFLRLLLAVAVLLTVLLVAPFAQPILFGGLIAYVVAPVNDRLSRRLGRTLGATLTMVLTVLVVVVPLAVLVGAAAEQAASLATTVELPDVASLETALGGWLGTEVDRATLLDPLSGAMDAGLRGLTGSLLGVVGGIPAFLVGSVVFLFTVFSLLRNGDDLLAWVRRAAPLEPSVLDELFERTDDLLWAAVVGNVVVAAVQATLTVLGFAAVGFDSLVFWGLVTFLLSLLPLIGASIVWVPAVAYLLLVGSTPQAVGLLVFGAVVISGSDNLVRPLAMRRGADLDSGLLVVGIFGGVALLGFVGLFVGPVLIGLAKAVVDVLVAQRDGPGGGT
jgi:predicted PurR-regulated permease PerM